MKHLCALLALVLLSPLSARGGDNTAPQANYDHQFVQITGLDDQRMRPFDELMVNFLREHHVPGAALAVVDGERLVYARGFGFSDVEHKTPVLPTSLFRIASISKPITAVAILQLVERGRLRLDEHVFDILPVEPHFEAHRREVDPRLAHITVLQLLQHTAGWDRDTSFDPMFQSVRIAKSLNAEPPANADAIIRFMCGQSLDFDPGQRYAYSNFGYALLGRIIEQRGGKPYEQFVREHVFQPIGTTHPRLGRTRERAPFEVRYYDERAGNGLSVFEVDLDQQVPAPYGTWYLEAMDAHGGWLASAVDLARFASALHATNGPRLLSDPILQTLVERPAGLAGTSADGKPLDAYYGCGWMVRPVQDAGLGYNIWHTGSLPGTSTLLVTRHDRRHWAVLFNSRNSPDDQRLSALIDPLLHKAADAVTEWPTEDRFPQYFHGKPSILDGR